MEIIAETDLGGSVKFSWKVDVSKATKLEEHDRKHVLQANSRLITNCYGKDALTISKSTVFGNSLECVLKNETLKQGISCSWLY